MSEIIAAVGLRQIILKLRKKDRDERMEEQAILDTYMEALAM